nr:MAG TPA: helix-turn-helix domain-containing protein [Herelleviridae sp.]
MGNLQYRFFADVDLNDPFFDSLKNSYQEFTDWFRRKAQESAYVFYGEKGLIDGFLYLKEEPIIINDCQPNLIASNPRGWLKIGTLKINAHGTKLGERFLKKIFDYAITCGFDDIYVTVFAQHTSLISLFERYGFRQEATKETSNGIELVLTKRLRLLYPGIANIIKNYPIVNFRGDETFKPKSYLLAIYPQWHSRLLPDSILTNEDTSIIQDVSPTNSIHKVYLAGMSGMERLRRGDILFIYRTSDNKAPAYYRALISSVCMVEEYRHIETFQNYSEFEQYCAPYSIFTPYELQKFWAEKRYPHILKFSYNIALPKRVIRKDLLEQVGLSENDYFGFMPLTSQQATNILRLGSVNASFVVY